MTGVIAALAAGQKLRSITVSADWGSSSGVGPLTSLNRTLTVPAGNPGTLKFSIAGSSAFKYRKGGAGAYTTITDGMTLSVSNGDTLQFQFTSVSADFGVLGVSDNTTGQLVGSWTATTS